MLHIWSQGHTFDSGQVGSVETRKGSIPFYREGIDINFINEMSYEFENMTDYINMWRAVMLDELFNELIELDRDTRTCLPRDYPRKHS